MTISQQVFSILLVAAFSWSASAGEHPHEDVHFIAEHMAEAPQDAHFFALPWPIEELEDGRWQGGVVIGAHIVSGGPFEVSGALFAVGATRGLSSRWGLDLTAFYDHFRVTGGSSREVLRADFLDAPPYDLPRWAAFSGADGTIRHAGFSLGAIRELSPGTSRSRWSLRFGAFVERLELEKFTVAYEVLEGPGAGATGVLDHSSTATFFTPFGGFQWIRPIGRHSCMAVRTLLGMPLPPGDFDGALSGADFSLSSANGDGSPEEIGDPFLSVGVAWIHLPSGLDIDLGVLAAFPAFEAITHHGLDKALLITLGWHPR